MLETTEFSGHDDVGLNVLRCRADMSGTTEFSGHDDVGLNVLRCRADMSGATEFSGHDDVGLNVLRCQADMSGTTEFSGLALSCSTLSRSTVLTEDTGKTRSAHCSRQ